MDHGGAVDDVLAVEGVGPVERLSYMRGYFVQAGAESVDETASA